MKIILPMIAYCLIAVNALAEMPAVVVEYAKQAGGSPEQAKLEFDRVILAIKAELKAGRDVTITNFGKFYVQGRDARTGRNPKTGAPIQIAAKKYPHFISADKFKDELNPVTAAVAPPEKANG